MWGVLSIELCTRWIALWIVCNSAILDCQELGGLACNAPCRDKKKESCSPGTCPAFIWARSIDSLNRLQVSAAHLPPSFSWLGIQYYYTCKYFREFWIVLSGTHDSHATSQNHDSQCYLSEPFADAPGSGALSMAFPPELLCQPISIGSGRNDALGHRLDTRDFSSATHPSRSLLHAARRSAAEGGLEAGERHAALHRVLHALEDLQAREEVRRKDRNEVRFSYQVSERGVPL